MSKLIATIEKIQTIDSLNIVSFDFSGNKLKMMSLELDEKIKVGTKVSLGVKSTSIAIAKEFSGQLSYSNQLNTVIDEIDNGELLSSINLKIGEIHLESIITLDSSKAMNLKVGDSVTALIKANELSITEVL